MRLWSLHPKYLDRAGLTACWREGLLAKKVLEGNTKGYKNHPQLARFKAQADPLAAVNAYLHVVVDEAERRGYAFDRSKLMPRKSCPQIPLNTEQLDYEQHHLQNKLAVRDPIRLAEIDVVCDCHPLFKVIEGPIESWEVVH